MVLGVADGPTLLECDDSDMLLAVEAVTVAAEKYRNTLEERQAFEIISKLGEAMS